MTLIEQFDREIQGEKLLYLNKEKYTDEESKLIIETIARRISKNYYYPSLISKYQPILTEKVWININEDELKEEKIAIEREFERIANLSKGYAEEERDFAHYNTKLDAGIVSDDNYFRTIMEGRISGKYLDNILTNPEASLLYDADVDLLITANMVFKRYPAYFDKEKVDSLDAVIFWTNKSKCNKEELKVYRVAEKEVKKNIRKFNKKEKQDAKVKAKRMI